MMTSRKISATGTTLVTSAVIDQVIMVYCSLLDQFSGTLLPLWKFIFETKDNFEITSLCWNPRYNDLFAASFGSFDFYHQQTVGYVCLFSLKNPSYPEFLCQTPCGVRHVRIFTVHSQVMCLDLHPDYPNMIVLGLYDGNVAVREVPDAIHPGARCTT
jgi:dynein intermediate chain 1